MSASTTGKNTVQCVLGTESYLRPIFSYYRMPASWDSEKTLREGIEHAFTFTMLRDQFYGGWAHCWKDAKDGKYHLKLTSPNPNDDVTDYAQLIPQFVKALAIAQKTIAGALKSQSEEVKKQLNFLPPFGLSMLNTRGVLLLHYPPDETITYTNYLHSRTTKRWDSLLIANGYNGGDNPLLMAITDVFPVTADGGSGGSKLVDKICEPVAEDLAKYAYKLLTILLRPKSRSQANVTQPMVALGGAVRGWLFNNTRLRKQIEAQIGAIKKPSDLKPLTQFNLQLQDKQVLTPVLMMDHPCKYYRGYRNDKIGAQQVKTDLIGTRWYIQMSENPELDPRQVLEIAKNYWNDKGHKPELDRIVKDQYIQFRQITSGTEA